MLVEERIIVKQLEEDLYDGQVLQKLLGEFTQEKKAPESERSPRLIPFKVVGCHETVQLLTVSPRVQFISLIATVSASHLFFPGTLPLKGEDHS